MTQEQKAKAYDEALERAKEMCSMPTDKATMEYIFPELRESEDERIRKTLIDELKVSKTIGELKFRLPYPAREECIAYLEKQKEQKHPNGCFTCDEYKKGYEEGRRNGFTAGYNKAMKEVEQKEQKPAWSEVELLFRGEKVTVKRPFYRDDKGRGYSTTEQDEEVAWNALRAWCEKKGISLYDLYPKAEWSEEDEDVIETLIRELRLNAQFEFAVKKLGLDYIQTLTVLDKCRRLRPRPSWKPSEEQMNCLCAAVDAAIRKHNESVSGYEPARVLKSLYEDLQRL